MKYLPIIILLLSSCITEKHRAKICASCPVVTEVVTVIKDTIITKESIKYDTTYLTVSGPTVVIPGPCDKLCDKNGKLKPFYLSKTTNGIRETISTDTTKNELNFNCKEDSLMQVSKEKTIEINKLHSEIIKSRETLIPRCEREHKDWLDKYDRPWFWLSLGAFLLWLTWKLFTMKASLLKLFTKLPFK